MPRTSSVARFLQKCQRQGLIGPFNVQDGEETGGRRGIVTRHQAQVMQEEGNEASSHPRRSSPHRAAGQSKTSPESPQTSVKGTGTGRGRGARGAKAKSPSPATPKHTTRRTGGKLTATPGAEEQPVVTPEIRKTRGATARKTQKETPVRRGRKKKDEGDEGDKEQQKQEKSAVLTQEHSPTESITSPGSETPSLTPEPEPEPPKRGRGRRATTVPKTTRGAKKQIEEKQETNEEMDDEQVDKNKNIKKNKKTPSPVVSRRKAEIETTTTATTRMTTRSGYKGMTTRSGRRTATKVNEQPEEQEENNDSDTITKEEIIEQPVKTTSGRKRNTTTTTTTTTTSTAAEMIETTTVTATKQTRGVSTRGRGRKKIIEENITPNITPPEESDKPEKEKQEVVLKTPELPRRGGRKASRVKQPAPKRSPSPIQSQQQQQKQQQKLETPTSVPTPTPVQSPLKAQSPSPVKRSRGRPPKKVTESITPNIPATPIEEKQTKKPVGRGKSRKKTLQVEESSPNQISPSLPSSSSSSSPPPPPPPPQQQQQQEQEQEQEQEQPKRVGRGRWGGVSRQKTAKVNVRKSVESTDVEDASGVQSQAGQQIQAPSPVQAVLVDVTAQDRVYKDIEAETAVLVQRHLQSLETTSLQALAFFSSAVASLGGLK